MDTQQLSVLLLIFAVVVWLCRRFGRYYRRWRPRISLGKQMTGTVYLAWDRSLSKSPLDPNSIIKIGVTQHRDVSVRMEGIRKSMGGDPVCIWKMDHVPYPYAVEFAAHQLMEKYRAYWLRGSTRGREWFHSDGRAGLDLAIAAITKACALVRAKARRRRRWSDKADSYISVWDSTKGRDARSYPYRTVSDRVEREQSRGGNKTKKAQARPSTPPARPGSRPRAGAAPSGPRSPARSRS